MKESTTDVKAQDGARRAIVRVVSVVAAWRRQEVVSWGGQ